MQGWPVGTAPLGVIGDVEVTLGRSMSHPPQRKVLVRDPWNCT